MWGSCQLLQQSLQLRVTVEVIRMVVPTVFQKLFLSKLRLTRAAKALVEPDVPGAGPSTSTATESVILRQPTD